MQINLLVPEGVALCSYDLKNNPCLGHIFCKMTIIAGQLTGLVAIFKMAVISNIINCVTLNDVCRYYVFCFIIHF